MRTFIAIDLAPRLKDALQGLVRDLSPLATNIRWVRTGGMHLTLKFLGEISDGQAAAVAAEVGTIAAGTARFSIRLRGVGAFPPGRSAPRVVWAGVEAGPGLVALQQRIETAVSTLGFEPERRPFQPHLTLGRAKLPGRQERLLQEMNRLKDREFGEMEVDRLTLFRSVLAPGGAEYSVLGEFELS